MNFFVISSTSDGLMTFTTTDGFETATLSYTAAQVTTSLGKRLPYRYLSITRAGPLYGSNGPLGRPRPSYETPCPSIIKQGRTLVDASGVSGVLHGWATLVESQGGCYTANWTTSFLGTFPEPYKTLRENVLRSVWPVITLFVSSVGFSLPFGYFNNALSGTLRGYPYICLCIPNSRSNSERYGRCESTSERSSAPRRPLINQGILRPYITEYFYQRRAPCPNTTFLAPGHGPFGETVMTDYCGSMHSKGHYRNNRLIGTTPSTPTF